MKWCIAIFFIAASTCASGAPEKVLFGQPLPSSSSSSAASLPAEARSSAPIIPDSPTSAGEGRKSRVISFPDQDSRSRPYGTNTGHVYDTTEERYDLIPAPQQDENRLLSLLPTFGDRGMQVGLDFKLPFFSIPYSKLFSGLRGTGPSGILGSGLFGSTDPVYGGTQDLSNSVVSSLPSSLATMTAMAVTAALLYPKITGLFTSSDGKGVYRTGNEVEDFMQNINSVLNQFDIDGESCAKVALCSLGNARRGYVRGRDNGHTTPADIIEDLMNLPAVKSTIAKGGFVQARDFGGSGGDCDYFNNENKCPVSSQTWHRMLASLSA